MHKDKTLAICEHFGLGHLISNATSPVSGGLLHKMWQVETTKGIFAIKELDPEIMKRAGSHKRYNYSEDFATYIASNGIQASVALSANKSHIYEVNGATIMVYPWIVGHSLEFQQITTEHAYQIGLILGRIHDLHLHNTSKPDELYEITKFTNEHWESIVNDSLNQNLINSNLLSLHLPNLIQWNNQYQPDPNSELVISHRDIDPKNVLWCDNSIPVLIDWESVGYINPTEDLITVALNWGGLDIRFNMDNFLAVIKGYYVNGRISNIHSIDFAFNNIIGNILSWLEYNISRSVRYKDYDINIQKISVQEINKTLGTLHFIEAHKCDLIDAIRCVI